MRFPFSLDLGRAAFAVALAVVLYFVAINETNPETTIRPSFTVPVQVVNPPPGLVATDQPPQVGLRVRALPSVLARLRPDSFTAQVDLSSAHGGQNDLPVIVRSTDPDVRGVESDPSVVTINLEEVQERVLPVRV